MRIAESIGGDTALARRAAELSKCDLLTLMVGEFPELQGLMGKYYAQHDGEHAGSLRRARGTVLAALRRRSHCRETRTGIALALADKLDTLAGIFAIGQKPTGTRDPFGLRRAALGVLRTILERQLDLDLRQLDRSCGGRAAGGEAPESRRGSLDVHRWSACAARISRAKPAARDHDRDVRRGAREPHAVAARHRRAAARARALPHAAGGRRAWRPRTSASRTSCARRRAISTGAVDTSRLQDGAERQLFEHVLSMERAVNPLFARREYAQALTQLASLRDDVDRFFDSVMVMAEDADVRANRLGLLLRLRGLFLQFADLSRLPG